jgi:hypothetical protein
MSLDLARTVADAVLFEGYLLYPYRASSRKNQTRWQFGVLGPPGAAEAGVGEEPEMAAQCLLRSGSEARVSVHLRFLQLQTRSVERATGEVPSFEPVDELTVDGRTWLRWDEAVEQEIELDPARLDDLGQRSSVVPVDVPGSETVEPLVDAGGTQQGRLVRRTWPLHALVTLAASSVDGLVRLSLSVRNCAERFGGSGDGVGGGAGKDEATRSSLIGAHLLVQVTDGEFVSLLEPPEEATAAAAACVQRRCWPVLAGAAGETDVVLISPIILYDYPEVAEQSAGALFDSTEIDEILTLRVMTLTDEEKAEARATDPRAAEIIDRCESMSPEALAQLHGILRDPHAGMTVPPPAPDPFEGFQPLTDSPAGFTEVRNAEPPTFDTGGVPWWDPEADASVQPGLDAVMVDGVAVSRDSIVRLHPSRRADAQDLFLAGQEARVTAVLSDVDGDVHVAVVLLDDPAADLHDWYGRYLYFAPEELEPLDVPHGGTDSADQRKESRS